MKSSDSSPHLSAQLSEWRVSPARNPAFRATVWARIIAARAGSPWSLYLRAHASVLAGALAAAIVLGAWIGREEARARVATDRAEIASAYVQALDARTMQMP